MMTETNNDASTTTDSLEALPATLPATMRAVGHQAYGDADVLEVMEVPTPTIADDQVLVKVESAALNPLDWHMMTGTPWIMRLQGGLRRPKQTRRGVDMAGQVIAVGSDVTDFAVGDDVFGGGAGAFAEYLAAKPSHLWHKPSSISFDEAAGLPVAAVTALQGLRDHAALEAGQHVLINGASGGVGSAAVQLAKWMGAEVTAVCSTRNVELVRSLGADHVIDYTSENFTETDTRYDVLFDNQGNHPLSACRRILTDTGVYLLVGGPKKNRLLGPIGRMVRAIVGFRFRSQRAAAFIADETQDELRLIAELVESGELRTHVDRTYPLADISDAMAHLASGRVRGKVIVHP